MARLIQSGLQLCPNCNAELPRNLATCPNCGAGLSGLISAPPVMAAPGTAVVAGPAVVAAQPVAVVHRTGINWGGLIAALLVVAPLVVLWKFGLFNGLGDSVGKVVKPALTEPARPDINLPGAVPQLAPAKLNMAAFVYSPPPALSGKFTYTITLQNSGGLPGVGSVRVKFLDKNGVVLDEDVRIGLLVPAGEKKEFAGENQLEGDKADRVATIQADLL